MKPKQKAHRSSKIADTLLKYLYSKPYDELYTNQMLAKFSFDKRNLAKKLRVLEAEGVIKSRELANLKLYSINSGNKLYKEYRAIALNIPRAEEEQGDGY